MTFAGVLAYKYLFFKASWRSIYIYSVVLTTMFSLMQLVLVFQINVRYGVSNYFFSMGDDVIQAYISGIQTLPVSEGVLSGCVCCLLTIAVDWLLIHVCCVCCTLIILLLNCSRTYAILDLCDVHATMSRGSRGL